MGTYFNEHQKKQRWESGQAILHRESGEAKEKSSRKKNNEPEDKKNRPETIKNSYGRLNYQDHGKKQGQRQQGFSLEAFEAPGTPLHTEKEKHLDPASMKKIRRNHRQTLFASEVPLRNQAIFYDMADSNRSSRFLKYMKHLLKTQGHQTLQDAFGFLDQEPEYRELEELKNVSETLSLEEFDRKNKRMDTVNSTLQKKQSRERQLCKDLQLMLDQHAAKKRTAAEDFLPKNKETTAERPDKNQTDSFRRRFFPTTEEDMAASADAPEEQPPENEIL